MKNRQFSLKIKMPHSNESEVLDSVGDYLTRKKHFFFRTNNAPTFQPTGQGSFRIRRQSKYSMNGVPDIILINSVGQFVGLEVKTVIGKQSDEQKLFEQRCKEKFAQYHIIRSIDDLQKINL
jgi:hypothetical protein